MKALALIFVIATISSCKSNDPTKIDDTQEPVQTSILDDLANPAQSNGLVIPPPDSAGRPETKYVSDKDHSSISFRTMHWDIVDLIGWFSDFEVVLFSDRADFTDAEIYAVVNPKSILMPNDRMQGSVQKHPYIKTDDYPEISFHSKGMEPNGGNTYKLIGEMTMNGITHEVPFDIIFNGFAYPGEQSICGWTVTGALDRHGFNVGSDEKLHSGRAMHADSIYLTMSLRME